MNRCVAKRNVMVIHASLFTKSGIKKTTGVSEESIPGMNARSRKFLPHDLHGRSSCAAQG
eukprot:1604228-Amphidinium_carterae.2